MWLKTAKDTIASNRHLATKVRNEIIEHKRLRCYTARFEIQLGFFLSSRKSSATQNLFSLQKLVIKALVHCWTFSTPYLDLKVTQRNEIHLCSLHLKAFML